MINITCILVGFPKRISPVFLLSQRVPPVCPHPPPFPALKLDRNAPAKKFAAFPHMHPPPLLKLGGGGGSGWKSGSSMQRCLYEVHHTILAPELAYADLHNGSSEIFTLAPTAFIPGWHGQLGAESYFRAMPGQRNTYATSGASRMIKRDKMIGMHDK